jgi:hypothetical protein
VPNYMYLIHPEHPPANPGSLDPASSHPALRWSSFRAANGLLSERRAHRALISWEEEQSDFRQVDITIAMTDDEARCIMTLAQAFDRRLMVFLSLVKITQKLVDSRRKDLIDGSVGVPSVAELAELSEIAHELERSRASARADEQHIWQIRQILNQYLED